MALDHIVQPFWLSVRLNDADKETRSKRALFPLTIYDLFTSACSASIRTAKVSRLHRLGDVCLGSFADTAEMSLWVRS